MLLMRFAIVCLAPLLATCAEPSAVERVEIVVYGGTSAGVVAAVTAARRGHSVVLVEPTQYVGGMSSSGLGATDIGNKAAIGGIAREFYQRVAKHYDDPKAWTVEQRTEFKGQGHRSDDDTAWTFEPHVAEQIFEDMLREENVNVIRGERLDLKCAPEHSDTRLTAITLEGGRRLAGAMFIDATYEGDLMAAAGVKFNVGREANTLYGETLNGVQRAQATKHQFSRHVDPYVVPGDPKSGLLPGVQAGPLDADGSGDERVQAYCFRLCATDVEANRIPWTQPSDYDARNYELLLRSFEAGEELAPWDPHFMPNRKTDANNNGPFSFDFIGENYAYATASWDERERIVARHRTYQQGLLWTLANDTRVPEKIRAQFNRFGLTKDEFVDEGGWPRLLYIREARRMQGEYVMTEHDCRGERRAALPVGLAAYTMDSHNVQRFVDESGAVRNEGDVQVGGFSPYGIDYGALLPRREQCSNLLVPVCLSASHIAYGSIRMEPVFMVLGQSSAIAAVLALQNGVELHELDYGLLKRELSEAGQILEWDPKSR